MTQTLKINIVGMGIMGKSVARALLRNPQVNITAVCDLNESTARAACETFEIESHYTDFREMFVREKPDAVFVATPDHAHFEPVMAALDSGIHVFVEKPMTTSTDEADRIVQKVVETGLKLQVAFNHRWLSPYNATWKMIREGKIGKCLSGYARKNNPITVPTEMIPWARNSSPMWFLSCHDIDLMTWWFDDDAVEVKAFGVKNVLKERFGWDTYDAMQALVRFAGGAIATFETAWIYPKSHPAMPDSFMEVIGQDGHFHLDRKTEAIEMSTPQGLAWPRSLLNYPVFDKWIGAFPSCVNSFIDAILEDREPYVTARDGRRSTAILQAIHASADTGEQIKLH